MSLGKLILLTGISFVVAVLIGTAGCSGTKEKELPEFQSNDVSEPKQPYERISAGMDFTEVKDLAGEPTDSWSDGEYIVWYYYRFPLQEIAKAGGTDNIKEGSYTITFFKGKVEEIDLLESDLKVYDNR